MLKLLAVIPHSALLWAGPRPPEIDGALGSIAEAISAAEIKHLVFIGNHARFVRTGFSAYTGTSLEAQFSELGELAKRYDLKMDWDLWHTLRAQATQPALSPQPIDDGRLDYAQSLAFQFLAEQKEGLPQKLILAINDAPSATEQQRNDFGRQLFAACESVPGDCAVILSGDLLLPDEKTPEVKERNLALRYQIESYYSSPQAAWANTEETCLVGPIHIGKGLLAQGSWKAQETAFVHAGDTSFLSLLLTRAA